MATFSLSIIIPVYNEDQIAASFLPSIFELPLDKEVIVINDGSTDNTTVVLKKLAQRFPFRLINQPTNQGKGAAVKRGLEEINGEYFIVCDADAEYDPRDIIRLLDEIKKSGQKTAVYGSRWLDSDPGGWHYLVNHFLTGLTNRLFSSRLTDMETCFKLIPASAQQDLRLRGKRFEIEPEITAQLLKADYKIRELPISYRRRSYKEGKKIKPRDGLLAIITLFRERFSA